MIWKEMRRKEANICQALQRQWDTEWTLISGGFSSGSDSKESACNAGNLGLIPAQEIPLEKGMATHSSFLAWRILWTEEPGRGLESLYVLRHIDWGKSNVLCQPHL